MASKLSNVHEQGRSSILLNAPPTCAPSLSSTTLHLLDRAIAGFYVAQLALHGAFKIDFIAYAQGLWSWSSQGWLPLRAQLRGGAETLFHKENLLDMPPAFLRRCVIHRCCMAGISPPWSSCPNAPWPSMRMLPRSGVPYRTAASACSYGGYGGNGNKRNNAEYTFEVLQVRGSFSLTR